MSFVVHKILNKFAIAIKTIEGKDEKMNRKEKEMLNDLYKEVKEKQLSQGDCDETYKNGYRVGYINGQVELLEHLLNINIKHYPEEK